MSEQDCLFCRIADGEIEADLVYQDEEILAFRDINPQAPVHILLIPRRHISSTDDVEDGDVGLVGGLVAVARDLARQEGVADRGYRLVLNSGPDAGQSVLHLHLHLLGGRAMRWPPG